LRSAALRGLLRPLLVAAAASAMKLLQTGDGEDGVIVVYEDADTVPSIKYVQIRSDAWSEDVVHRLACWYLPGGHFGVYPSVLCASWRKGATYDQCSVYAF
jgi:hypothetical protein